MAEGAFQEAFAKADGRGLGGAVQAAVALLNAAPFGSPIAVALSALYDKASQTATNTANCRKLVRVAVACCTVLARAPPEVLQRNDHAVAELQAVLLEAQELVADFGPKSFFRRLLSASGDAQAFEELSGRLGRWINVRAS